MFLRKKDIYLLKIRKVTVIKVYKDGEYQGEYDTLRKAADAHRTHVSLAYATSKRRAMMTKKGYSFCSSDDPFTPEELQKMKEKAAKRNAPKEPKRNWQTKTIEGVGTFDVFQLPRKKSEKIEAIKSLFNAFDRKTKINKMRYAYLEELLEAL